MIIKHLTFTYNIEKLSMKKRLLENCDSMFHCAQLPSIPYSQSEKTKEPDEFLCVFCGRKYFHHMSCTVFKLRRNCAFESIVGTLIERKSGDDTLSVSHQCAADNRSPENEHELHLLTTFSAAAVEMP
jgi:hypothetical protein